MQSLKNLLLLFITLLSAIFATAQKTEVKAEDNNAIKINLSSLIIRSISVQYERKLNAKNSAALSVRYMPFGKLPFASTVEKILNDPYTAYAKLNRLKIGAFGVTPEFRFYLSHKGAMHGFYIGPFANYSTYKTDLPIDYNNKTGIFNGNVQTFTGGIQIGVQWKIVNKVYLDWYILGPNYGGSSGNLIFTGNLSLTEQSVMQDELAKLKQQVPFGFGFIKSYSVSDKGAAINIKGPWAGLRGLGFNLAYHF